MTEANYKTVAAVATTMMVNIIYNHTTTYISLNHVRVSYNHYRHMVTVTVLRTVFVSLRE